jgi:hypothetical protein
MSRLPLNLPAKSSMSAAGFIVVSLVAKVPLQVVAASRCGAQGTDSSSEDHDGVSEVAPAPNARWRHHEVETNNFVSEQYSWT